MTTLLISDLHLEPGRPEITRLFFEFLDGEATHAQSLYILGDLFEFWIGDDYEAPPSKAVGQALRTLSDRGTAVFFMHGNRDFLLGDEFADQAGMTLLPQAVKLELHGVSTLLLHGDSLCTDDVEYQQVREKVRTQSWQDNFLGQSIEERLAFANAARDASRNHTESAAEQIMDVNQQAVEDVMRHYGVNQLIHGHTHRPAVHTLSLAGSTAERIVLGDWYEKGSVLRVKTGSFDLAALPI